MQKNLTKKAVEAALNCDWERAIDYNTAIIRQDPQNIQAINRLARAYLETGQKQQAKELCEEVLKIDKYNPIALKNLSLIPNTSLLYRKAKALYDNGQCNLLTQSDNTFEFSVDLPIKNADPMPDKKPAEPPKGSKIVSPISGLITFIINLITGLGV
jgi:tetratricopeptide (TPR) repeat protein